MVNYTDDWFRIATGVLGKRFLLRWAWTPLFIYCAHHCLIVKQALHIDYTHPQRGIEHLMFYAVSFSRSYTVIFLYLKIILLHFTFLTVVYKRNWNIFSSMPRNIETLPNIYRFRAPTSSSYCCMTVMKFNPYIGWWNKRRKKFERDGSIYRFLSRFLTDNKEMQTFVSLIATQEIQFRKSCYIRKMRLTKTPVLSNIL